jgi:hypothetical protein
VTAAEKHVAAAYLVVFAVVLLYVLIIAAKLQRLEQTLQNLSSMFTRAREYQIALGLATH